MKCLFLSFILVVFCIWLSACSKPSDAPAPVSSASSVAISVVDAAAPAAMAKWSGTYSATPASLSVPDGGEWAGTKWHGDDAGDGVGDGTLVIEIHDGIVSGSVDGPLGPALIDGTSQGSHFSARVDRKDPKDGGFVGVLDGTIANGSATGEMHLSSLVTAHLLRQATFQLKNGG
ncbi:MAG: hypothetical protein ABI183_16950 [Polyangiaceae bacterium]